ncbi:MULTISPECIES: hypothetical protein [Bacillus amyloliquefaciens group]|uniref:Uncharacterized protein n=1 Tax=Bacillus amyloliquefaciens TaxID=1390 RepID=A0AAP3YGB0_BACAM|nr:MULTISPECIES: hypothetical protein [Bacillus amyloliquefaciens group]MDF4194823.1 hypothetical protein [Bacillus amyloliquefaciens]MDF4213150.1 hypothetical protein [Bacillus amyloliquefaciens]MDH3102705.1 hypothetical protein [Bacillus velezensis]
MKQVYLHIRWEDLHGEIGLDSFNLLRLIYLNLSEQELIEAIKALIFIEREDIAAKFDIHLSENSPVFNERQYVVYKGIAGEINYRDMLISLASALEMSNTLDHVQNIMSLAKCLRSFDREIFDRFAKDIAEEVYYSLK